MSTTTVSQIVINGHAYTCVTVISSGTDELNKDRENQYGYQIENIS